ncbi:DNA/RNA non-specific endonuclease [Mesorhizobium sp. C386A]|uniref:DNA/RNA non-specific endonuclease n=2 Tax=unclassified Mesorhizobium TaxID=325217 RepID=UPI0003CF1A91|nr:MULTISPECIES: DNA/RNA non-specific endonuclease [unclassified Mesorhizobium]ESY10534.1 hypothetical protein X752_15110 [Mesorhizobium sp. LNJC398B00]ESY35856.1 hypothetical protein X748_15650 [Mesorhizobium sp. LNJC386A00]
MSDELATGTETETPADFISLSDIRIAHLELMRIASSNEAVDPSMSRSDKAGAETTEASIDNTAPDAQAIRDFLAKARRAGSSIARESDRRAAQRILDYWSAELVTRPGITSADVSPARLASFAGGGGLETVAVAADDPGSVATDAIVGPAKAGPTASGSNEQSASDDELSSDELTERFRIRVAAQARQWKNTGYAGYLLRGEALKEAAELPQGADIAEFVEASAKAETDSQKQRDRSKNLLIAVFATLTAILAGTTYFAFNQRNDAVVARSNAEQAQSKAETAANEVAELNKHLSAALAEAKNARVQAEAARDVALKNAEDAAKRLREQQDTQATLRSAIGLVIDQLKDGNISLEKLTPDLKQAVLVELAGRIKSSEISLSELPAPLQSALEPLLGKVTDKRPNVLTGYKVDFIQANIALPRLTGDLASDTSRTPLDYINYSLVMGRSHRMAIYSAVNLDRSQRMTLQVTGSGLRYDNRLLDDLQPDRAWYLRPDRRWLPARLANASDIAWGPEFTVDAATAALKLAQYTYVLPNTMPQSSAFYETKWAPLENWVRTQHNPLANKVTIFSGTIFNPTSHPIDGVPVPNAYWKLAVSSVPAAVKDEAREPDFVVDAFLIPGDATGEFNVEQYRLPVAELERRTSLNFGTLIEWTDSVKNPGPNGTAADDLAGRVKLLDSADGATDALRGELIAALGNADLAVPERRKIVAALVEMAGLQSMTGLTPARRSNVLETLLSVPPDLWNRPDWLPVFAAARRAVADLDISAAGGQAIIGDQDREALNTLKDRLRIQQHPQTVYVQFDGMTRDGAQALSAKMRALGWGIPTPGEEQVDSAAGKNEVRYNPDADADRYAAELLAADLTAAGQAVIARAVPIIGANTLEIWISI